MRTPHGPARTLTRRLHDLADEGSPDAGTGFGGVPRADGGDLWARGRRRQRRQRLAAGALSLLLVLGLGSLTTAVVTSAREGVAPAEAGAVLGLPDRLYTPSVWLDDTGGRGPLGPLVAVLGAERRSLGAGASPGIVGVSATGEYAFLDLPDRTTNDELGVPPALSADGRFVAYPSSDPGGGPGSDWVTGVSVYDSVSGDVERRDLRGDLGRTTDGLALGRAPPLRRLLRGHRALRRQRLGRAGRPVRVGRRHRLDHRRGRRAGRPGGGCRPRPRGRRRPRGRTTGRDGRRRPVVAVRS